MIRLNLLVIGFLAMLLGCATPQSPNDRSPANAVTAAKFCAELKKNDPARGRSLAHVRQTFTSIGMIPQGTSLGAMANDATDEFRAANFVDSLAEAPGLLDRPDEVINGSVFLLKRTPNCPRVNSRAGHVAVKCDGKIVLVQPGFREISMDDYKDCVYSVMRHSSWPVTSSTQVSEPEGEDIEGQQSHP